MIAVDTNVLVRLFVADEPAQAAKAQKLFDAAADREIAVWVSDTVLVELVWTLGRAYARDVPIWSRRCGPLRRMPRWCWSRRKPCVTRPTRSSVAQRTSPIAC